MSFLPNMKKLRIFTMSLLKYVTIVNQNGESSKSRFCCKTSKNIWIDLIFGVLTPLSTIFQLYHGDQF